MNRWPAAEAGPSSTTRLAFLDVLQDSQDRNFGDGSEVWTNFFDHQVRQGL